MTRLLLCIGLTMTAAFAQQAKVTSLLTKDLMGIAGKEAALVSVEYPPGAMGAVHRHNAHVIVYVLEGSIVMQVRGGKQQTLKAGETFYETPEDIHVVGQNASKTQPAKFLAFFVKDKGTPLVEPVK